MQLSLINTILSGGTFRKPRRCTIGLVRAKATRSVAVADLTTPQAVERFRKAAKDFTARVTKSRNRAHQALVDEGIYTKSGKLTKRYS
jgi:hypothetical protein